MNQPNEIIPIFEGEFSIKNGDTISRINGNITYRWFPEMRVEFAGELINSIESSVDSFLSSDRNGPCEIIINGLVFGKGHITTIDTNFTNASIRGYTIGQSVLNDSSIAVSSVRFKVANLRDVNGPITQIQAADGKTRASRNRLIFSANDYTINLDKISGFKKATDYLHDEGGYSTLHNGEITSVKHTVKLSDIQDLIHCFSTFLTFINGRRCSLLFLTGVFEEDIIWSDFTPRHTDQYKTVSSWSQVFDISGIDTAWQQFYKIWQTNEGKEFITTAIHWYVEANSHAAFTEGSIVLTQTALELLYNWVIVEKKGVLLGKDAENISASNKIRLLLNALNITFDIPPSLTDLLSFQSSTQEISDGPEAFVNIRNAIVHSQVEKRKKLMQISSSTKYQSLKLGIWYLELALLNTFNFNGKYRNRCSISNWAGEDEEYVPWVKLTK